MGEVRFPYKVTLGRARPVRSLRASGHELALWLYGPPGGGRSTFLAGLGAMLGPRAGLLGLSEIQRNRFALADIPGKTLLTATEQPAGYLRTSHVLNALISGEPIQVEKKYRDPFVLLPEPRLRGR